MDKKTCTSIVFPVVSIESFFYEILLAPLLCSWLMLRCTVDSVHALQLTCDAKGQSACAVSQKYTHSPVQLFIINSRPTKSADSYFSVLIISFH